MRLVPITELRREAVRPVDSGAQQRGLELGERMGSWDHLCDQPFRGSSHGVLPYGRDQPGANHARLAGTARPDQCDQPIAPVEPAKHLGKQPSRP